jgi:hypothetical protein
VLRSATPWRASAIAVTLGACVGVVARSVFGMDLVFALLVLSAAVVAIAQQTLP